MVNSNNWISWIITGNQNKRTQDYTLCQFTVKEHCARLWKRIQHPVIHKVSSHHNDMICRHNSKNQETFFFLHLFVCLLQKEIPIKKINQVKNHIFSQAFQKRQIHLNFDINLFFLFHSCLLLACFHTHIFLFSCWNAYAGWVVQ